MAACTTSLGIGRADDERSYVKDVERMADFMIEQLTSVGVTAEKRPIGTHKLDGKEVDLPPAVIGHIGNDSKKVSVLLPSHVLVLSSPPYWSSSSGQNILPG